MDLYHIFIYYWLICGIITFSSELYQARKDLETFDFMFILGQSVFLGWIILPIR